MPCPGDARGWSGVIQCAWRNKRQIPRQKRVEEGRLPAGSCSRRERCPWPSNSRRYLGSWCRRVRDSRFYGWCSDEGMSCGQMSARPRAKSRSWRKLPLRPTKSTASRACPLRRRRVAEVMRLTPWAGLCSPSPAIQSIFESHALATEVVAIKPGGDPAPGVAHNLNTSVSIRRRILPSFRATSFSSC